MILTTNKKNKAVALIITVSVLLVLSTVSVTFVRLTSLERKSSSNYVDKVTSRLYAFAGLDHAVGVLAEEETKRGFTSFAVFASPGEVPAVPWRYPHNESVSLREAINEDFPLDPDETTGLSLEEGIALNVRYSGLLKEDNISLDSYSLKIIDTSGQINLNSHIAMPIGGVSGDQESSNEVLNRIIKNLAVNCNFSIGVAQNIADALIDINFNPSYTNENEPLPKRWENIEEVVAVINSLSASEDLKQRFFERVTIASFIDKTTSRIGNAVSGITPTTIPVFVGEARSPININVASKEVLSSLIQGITASSIIIDNNNISRAEQVDIDDVFDDTNVDSEVSRIEVVIAGNKTIADSIASKIVEFRKQTVFSNWNIFNDFLTTLQIGVDLPLNNAIIEALHPDPNAPEISDNTLGNDVWEKICRDVFKANFNPNNVDNKFNPSQHASMRVVKSDLFIIPPTASLPSPGTTLEFSYSTEFSFSSMGVYEITSLGQITHVNAGIISQTILESNVSIVDILQHTTQQHFETPAVKNGNNFSPAFTNTTTYPSVMNKGIGATAEIHVGRVEPEVSPTAPTNTLFSSNFSPKRDSTTPALPNSNSDRFTSLFTNNRDMNIGTIRGADNNLLNDGIFSDIRQVSNTNNLRYHSIPAMPNGVVRGENTTPGSQISYYKGSLEFWVKLTEPSNAQVACGLISATFINPNPPYNVEEGDLTNSANSEGVQFYIFKNTLGELRFSRMYFCLTFDESEQNIGTFFTTNADGWDIEADQWQGAREANGFRFPHPRQDIVVRANELSWEANTWHHIAASWGGVQTGSPVDVKAPSITIDGVPIESAVVQNIDFTPDTPEDPEYCLLNEKAPKDCLNIGGFFRPQVDVLRGLFKFGENIDFAANGTIANLRTFAEPEDATGLINRFDDASAVSSFVHSFVIPKKGALGSLHWSSYPEGKTNATVIIKDDSDANIDSFTEVNSTDNDLPLNGIGVKKDFRVEYQIDFNFTDNDIPVLDDVYLRIIRVSFLDIKEI